MTVAVVGDLVAPRDDGACERAMALHTLADAEEGRGGIVLIEHIEHATGDFGVRPIIDGDRDRGGRDAATCGARNRWQMCPVRTEQVATRPQSTPGKQEMIGEERRKRPGPPMGLQERHPGGTRVQGHGGSDER